MFCKDLLNRTVAASVAIDGASFGAAFETTWTYIRLKLAATRRRINSKKIIGQEAASPGIIQCMTSCTLVSGERAACSRFQVACRSRSELVEEILTGDFGDFGDSYDSDSFGDSNEFRDLRDSGDSGNTSGPAGCDKGDGCDQ